MRGREDHGGRVGRAGKFNSWLIFHLGSDLDIVDADELVIGLDESATVGTAVRHNRCDVHPRVALLFTDDKDSGSKLFMSDPRFKESIFCSQVMTTGYIISSGFRVTRVALLLQAMT